LRRGSARAFDFQGDSALTRFQVVGGAGRLGDQPSVRRSHTRTWRDAGCGGVRVKGTVRVTDLPANHLGYLGGHYSRASLLIVAACLGTRVVLSRKDLSHHLAQKICVHASGVERSIRCNAGDDHLVDRIEPE
jgi:hypothetical protein